MNRIDFATSCGQPVDGEGIGVDVSQTHEALDVTARQPVEDIEGDIALMLSTPDGDTRLHIHLDDATAAHLAKQIADIQTDPSSRFPLPVDCDDSREMAE